jgi:CRP-like cAMP-binding protein
MATNHQSPLLGRKEVLNSSTAFGNDVLAELLSIPDLATYLRPELKVVPLTVNQVLYEPRDQIDYVYFPLDSVVSDLSITEDGTTIETSMVGRDGVVGMSTLLGSECSRQWIWVTISGNAIQLNAKLLDRLLIHNATALKSFLRYYRALMIQLSQRCVCNTRHTILERLCCWLLMIHDRVGQINLSLTQEMIASRVGARRAGITVAAGLLQEMNGIAYRRGRVHIENREALTRVVCECYNNCKLPLDL